MIAAVDSAYTDALVQTAVVLFRGWADSEPAVHRVRCETDAYQPGEFYRRELPVILEAIEPYLEQIEAVVVDGYVWLNDQGRPGLGAHLYEALNQKVAVVGVAKNYFAGSSGAKVYRGTSKYPLYVTSAGLGHLAASRFIENMAGPHRIPTLLKRVDHLSKIDLDKEKSHE